MVGGVFGAGVYDRTETVDDARGQSARAQERLDELDPEGELVVAIISGKDYFARDAGRRRAADHVRAARAARA